ncbi:MAG: N-acetylmuramoyl-L-alanine amidase, partial [Acidobacteriota bacterium]|nr:N-acetylmuramoyl-L-alanine amidase [Acidobacteriota bacterium]
FRYQSDHIYNPERIFFDLIGAKPQVGGKRLKTKEVGDGLLKRIRIAETLPGVTRVVLDLQVPVEITASQLSNPDRLMIELRPAGRRAVPLPSPAREPAPITRSDGPVALPAIPSAPPPVLIPQSSTVSPAFGRAVAGLKRPEPVRHEPAPEIAPESAAFSAANPARRTTSDGSRSFTRALGLKINRVVIDAGHGGHDQGTVGPKGLMEKELVLDVALRLGKLIEQRMGAEVIYTRADDTFIPLEQRTAIANQKKADLFLSVHANSSPSSKVTGVETFYLNFTTSGDSLDVAARENASSQKSVFELHDLIQSITLNDKVEESKEFAGSVESSLQSFATRYSPGAKDRGIKKAPFVVLIGASMPSVLAEIGFISNPHEESLLKRSEHRQKLAEALYRGVSRYAQNLSHFEVARGDGRSTSVDAKVK